MPSSRVAWTSYVAFALVCSMGDRSHAQTLLFDFLGQSPGDTLGAAIDEGADVDADGVPDLFLGFQSATVQGLIVRSGRDGSVLHELDSVNDDASRFFAVVGDVDQDGHTDFAMKAAAAFPGAVHMVSGKDGSFLWTATGAALGVGFDFPTLSAAGDVNRDGTPDVMIGEWKTDSTVLVLSGSSGVELHRFVEPFTNLGFAMDQLGDLDGDGFDDLLFTTMFSMRVVSGQTGTLIREVTPNGVRNVNSVAAPGDLNGDGIPDLLLGWSATNGDSLVEVYSGQNFVVIDTLTGDDPNTDQFGMSVHGVADMTGDGVVEYLIGAPEWFEVGSSGYARLYSGRTGNLLYTFRGRQPTAGLGESVRGAGDVNGDGLGDLMLAAPLDDTGAPDAGAVQIVAGTPLFLSLDERDLKPGDNVTMTLAEGTRGAMTMLAVTAFNATPLFVPLAFGFIPASERWTQTFGVPAIAAGHTFGVRGYTLVAGRGLRVTVEESLTVQ